MFDFFVTVDVENVCVDIDGLEEEDGRKTRAKPGAGTGMLHVVSQSMVTISSVPCKRPSDAKVLFPKVYRTG